MTQFCRHSPGLNSRPKPSQFGGTRECVGRTKNGFRRQGLLFGPGKVGEELSNECNNGGTVPTTWAAMEGRRACWAFDIYFGNWL